MLAIYTRLSKEDNKSTSINNQQREGVKFASKLKTTYKLYNEGEGVSGGAEIKDRPQLFLLLQDIRNNLITSVWFRNQNRLERSNATYFIFTEECKKYNVDIYFNDVKFDYNNAQDNLFGTIKSALNQYQKDLQSAQTKRTLRDNILEGKVWSIVAYGYKSDNGYLKIDDKEAEIVKQIYSWSLQGIGTDTIADRLNKKGVVSRKGGLFRSSVIMSIIKNSIYKGKRLYSGEYFDCDAIVTEDYWQQVNDNLKNNRNNSGKKVEYKYLLKGIIKCGECGRNYYGHKRLSGKDNTYKCSSKRHKDLKCNNRGINIDFIEDLIWGQLFVKKEFLNAYKLFIRSNSLSQNVSKLNKCIKETEKEIETNNKKVDRVLDQLLDDDYSLEIKQKLNNKIKQITQQTSDLKLLLTNYYKDLKLYTKTDIIDLTSLKNIRFNKANFNTKQNLIKEFIQSVNVYFDFDLNNYYIKINFNVKAMQPFVYRAPFNKKYALKINDFTLKDFTKIDKEEVIDNLILFYPNKILPKKIDFKINLNEYNYFLKHF